MGTSAKKLRRDQRQSLAARAPAVKREVELATNPTADARRPVMLDGLGICLDINSVYEIRMVQLKQKFLNLSSEEKDAWLKKVIEQQRQTAVSSPPEEAGSAPPAPPSNES